MESYDRSSNMNKVAPSIADSDQDLSNSHEEQKSNVANNNSNQGQGFNLFKEIKSSFKDVVDEVKSLPKEIFKMFQSATEDFDINRYVSEALSIRELVVYRTQRNENGESVPVEVNLDDIFRPMIRRMGLTNKNNPNHPATNDAISKLKVIDIAEENEGLDEDEQKIE